jgi:choline kinase
VRGIVLAAGGGTRLRPLTDTLPKTLLPVDGDRSILELAVENLAAVEVTDIVVVSGHAAHAIDDVAPRLAARYGVELEVRFNDRFDTANNAYSLWTVRDRFDAGAVLVNGDTVHPVSVEERLLDARGAAPLLLAVDRVKELGAEEMKVTLSDAGLVRRISKQLDPASACGEYIGVSLLEPEVARPLTDALQRTFDADPGRWYEDAYQDHIDVGGEVAAVAIGAVAWGEVDDHADLARIRSLWCRS